MGCGSGASSVGVVNVEVPKQDLVSRSIRNSSRHKGKKLMGMKQNGLTRGLIFRGG
jgi:hypothetical protein